MNYKTPWLAVNLSMLFPGLGQIYAGEKFKGLTLIFLEIILILIAFWSLLSANGNTIIGWSLLLLSVLVYMLNLFDTHFCMKKIMGDELIEDIPRHHKDAWYAVCLNQIFPGVGHIYIKQITLGFM
ncbi:MAG TPA: signal peptidase I, partial [Allocoleopsis sp.]